MLTSSEDNSKLHPHKKAAPLEEIEIDIASVDFTGLDEYDPHIEYRGGVL